MANRIVTATVTGETIKLSSNDAGAAGSFNAVSLAFTFDAAWDGTTSKIVQFLDAYGANPVNITLSAEMLVSGAYIVPIPAEPLVYAGEINVTVRGVDFEIDGTTAERIIMSASAIMKVKNSLYKVGGATPVEPTPTQAEQLLTAVNSVTGMTATAVELASGVTAYVTKTDNVDGTINLEFGLPAGPQGTQGVQGEQGIQGVQGIQGIQGIQGYRIGSVYRKSGTGASGTTDVYGMKLNDVSETEVGTFNVYNGADGEGAGDMLASVYDPNAKNADAFNVDNHASGTTNKVYTAIEQTKLSNIATEATKNSADATLLARANHTGTQLKSTISDFSHAHGNITNDGKIGSTADLPIFTGTDGTLITKTIADAKTLLGIAAGAQIATGSYTGNGTFDEANANSYTFATAPKFVVVAKTNGSPVGIIPAFALSTSYSLYGMCFLVNNVNNVANTWFGMYCKKSSDGKTIYWFNTATTNYQFNNNSTIYSVLSIG